MNTDFSPLKLIDAIVASSEFPSKKEFLDLRQSNSVALQLNEIVTEARSLRSSLLDDDALRHREEQLFHYAAFLADSLFARWDYAEFGQAIFPLFFDLLPVLTGPGWEEFNNEETTLLQSTLGPDSPVLDIMENAPGALRSLKEGCNCGAISDPLLFRTLTLPYLQPEVVSLAVSNTDEDYPWYVRASGWAAIAINGTAAVPTVGLALVSIGVGAVAVTAPKPKFPPEQAPPCKMALFIEYDAQKGFYVGGLLYRDEPFELLDGKATVLIHYGRYPNLSNVIRKQYDVQKGVFGFRDFESYLSDDLTKWDLIAGKYPGDYWIAKGISYAPNYNPCTTNGLPRKPGSRKIPR